MKSPAFCKSGETEPWPKIRRTGRRREDCLGKRVPVVATDWHLLPRRWSFAIRACSFKSHPRKDVLGIALQAISVRLFVGVAGRRSRKFKAGRLPPWDEWMSGPLLPPPADGWRRRCAGSEWHRLSLPRSGGKAQEFVRAWRWLLYVDPHRGVATRPPPAARWAPQTTRAFHSGQDSWRWHSPAFGSDPEADSPFRHAFLLRTLGVLSPSLLSAMGDRGCLGACPTWAPSPNVFGFHLSYRSLQTVSRVLQRVASEFTILLVKKIKRVLEVPLRAVLGRRTGKTKYEEEESGEIIRF